jgi:hypothetical protein
MSDLIQRDSDESDPIAELHRTYQKIMFLDGQTITELRYEVARLKQEIGRLQAQVESYEAQKFQS